ncbi:MULTISPECIES: hypothetical protein [Halostella]
MNKVLKRAAEEHGLDKNKADHEIQKLKSKGEIYEPRKDGNLRLTENRLG